MLPATLPLFPLPNVVLFPTVFLPLHVFEPRYRQLVADALTGDRVVGMTLLRPGWEGHYEGRPAIYEIGCAGLITHVEQLPEGRYNLVLKGLQKFRVVSEDESRLYRLATVEAIVEPMTPAERESLRDGRHRLELQMAPIIERSERRLPSNLEDDEVVNALSQYLDLEVIERQALLECANPAVRGSMLLELLHMRSIAAPRQAGAPPVH